MIGVIQQVIAGVGVQKDHQPVSADGQPGQYNAEQFGAKGQLAAPVGVRADRAFVDAAHADAKSVRRFFAQGARLVDGAGVVIDVGVIALDSLHKRLFKIERSVFF